MLLARRSLPEMRRRCDDLRRHDARPKTPDSAPLPMLLIVALAGASGLVQSSCFGTPAPHNRPYGVVLGLLPCQEAAHLQVGLLWLPPCTVTADAMRRSGERYMRIPHPPKPPKLKGRISPANPRFYRELTSHLTALHTNRLAPLPTH